MLTPSELRAVKQIRATARAVVGLAAGLREGASQLRGSIAMLPPALRLAHPATSAFLQAYPSNLATGEARLYLAEAELLLVDAQAAKLEAAHRPQVLAECRALYFQYSKLLHESNEPANEDGV